MSVLWLKFPDEIVFYNEFTSDTKRKLEDIFSSGDASSPWSRALEIIGLEKPHTDAPMIYWHENLPYFNWSCMMQTISGGGLKIIKSENGGYGTEVNYRNLGKMLKNQWKLARFMAEPEMEDKLTESIALGLVLQSLVMRLGAGHGNMNLWLANPQSAPRKYRGIIIQIQKVQMRRTQISGVWTELFPQAEEIVSHETILPEFFWDDERPVPTHIEELVVAKDKWQGLSVCAGEVTGLALVVNDVRDLKKIMVVKKKYNAPVILIFRHARPETTELFQFADAVLYAEGGVLSHACTVIREMNIPCITNLKSGFFTYFKERENVWIKVDAAGGVVERVGF